MKEIDQYKLSAFEVNDVLYNCKWLGKTGYHGKRFINHIKQYSSYLDRKGINYADLLLFIISHEDKLMEIRWQPDRQSSKTLFIYDKDTSQNSNNT